MSDAYKLSSSGDNNMSDDTKLTKTDRGSLETDAVVFNDEDGLCCEFSRVKIDSNSTGADDQQVQDNPCEAQSEEQSYEPGTSRHTPAGGAEGSGSASEGTQSEIEAQFQAIPLDDDDQTAATTRQESLPLATKPKVTAVASQTPQPTLQEPPEEDEEHYDFLLLYSQHNTSEAQQFQDIAKNANWKVVTSDDFLPNQTKLRSFEDVYNKCSFTVLLLTSNFFADVWCERRYQEALVQSIENPAKSHTVIPVTCQHQDFKLPSALAALNGIHLKCPLFAKKMQKIIKVERRLKREEAEREKQT